jgi:serine/threonine protein kinase/tetratricopeptide (TPR) repeat protein
MPAVFLSYRRADCPDTVKLLYERLKARLPRWKIFYDHTSIDAGEAFPERLRKEVIAADVVLAVIGPRWLPLLRERRNGAIDHVREEIRLAVESERTLVPVAVMNAAIPSEAELADCEELQPLARRNGWPLRPEPDFDSDFERLATFFDRQAPNEVLGTVLAGKYKMIREIGKGGMGVVYLAEQVQPKRLVAVKLIKPGMDSQEVLARFDAERQALAVMDHPNIARVLDAGVAASGRPYFVMEYVKGEPITDFCDAKKLTPNERLTLVQKVCHAIQHAHQKAIIHRDVKPSNILVELMDGRPEPKVIDFGLAKALGGKLTDKTLVTETGRTVGTLLYSSPEQAAGRTHEVDTRTDIYSLGAVLYELLAGTPPFSMDQLQKVGDEAIKRTIMEATPARPSTKLSSSRALPTIAAGRRIDPAKLPKFVRGDLDRIVMKSLEKEPKDRYGTANDLADDLARFLAGEPVKARPVHGWERAWKWAKRRPVQSGLAAGLVLAIAAGTIASWLFAAKAEREAANALAERDRANRERDVANEQKRRTREALDSMISDQMIERLATQKVLTEAQHQFLRHAIAYYQDFAAAEGTDEAGRAMEASAYFRVGSLLQRLGQNREAEPPLRAAKGLYERLAADYPAVPAHRRELARCLGALAVLLVEHGQLVEAEAAYQSARALQERLVAEEPSDREHRSDLALVLDHLGVLLNRTGRNLESESAHRAALAIREKLAADFPAEAGYRESLAGGHTNLGKLLYDQNRCAESETSYRAAATIYEKLASDFPTVPEYREDIARTQNGIGILLVETQRYAAAEPAFRAALSVQQQLVADYPGVPLYRRDLARTHNGLGVLYKRQGKFADAQSAYRAAASVQEKLVTDYPTDIEYAIDLASGYGNVGSALSDAGDHAGALAWHTKAVERMTPIVTRDPRLVSARETLRNGHWGRAVDYKRLRQYTEALPEWERALEFDDGGFRATIRRGKADCLARLGRVADAVALLEQAAPGADASATAFYHSAGVLAVAAGQDSTAGDKHAARAVDYLRRALSHGYDDVRHLVHDDDLTPLRRRADYATLLWEIAEATSAPANSTANARN